MHYENNRNLAKCLPELKDGDDGQTYIRPLSSMTNIERQEWGLILEDELEEDLYSWLVRHNFLEDKEIDIGLSKSLKGPNPPIYL